MLVETDEKLFPPQELKWHSLLTDFDQIYGSCIACLGSDKYYVRVAPMQL
jgi:hypothetical protein